MEQLWEICQPDAGQVQELASRLSCHPATAAVLVNRHITEPQAARRFIDDGLGQLPPRMTSRTWIPPPSAYSKLSATRNKF